MDATQVLRPTSPTVVDRPDVFERLATARRAVNSLPLGSWSGPPFDGGRWNPGAAARELERALFRSAAAAHVSVAIDDSPDRIARRLVRCHVVEPSAADGALALLDVLRSGDRTGDAAKLAERLIGYLDHRTTVRPSWASRWVGSSRSC